MQLTILLALTLSLLASTTDAFPMIRIFARYATDTYLYTSDSSLLAAPTSGYNQSYVAYTSSASPTFGNGYFNSSAKAIPATTTEAETVVPGGSDYTQVNGVTATQIQTVVATDESGQTVTITVTATNTDTAQEDVSTAQEVQTVITTTVGGSNANPDSQTTIETVIVMATVTLQSTTASGGFGESYSYNYANSTVPSSTLAGNSSSYNSFTLNSTTTALNTATADGSNSTTLGASSEAASSAAQLTSLSSTGPADSSSSAVSVSTAS